MQNQIILVFNCGSSSIKFAVINVVTEQVLFQGQVESICTANATLSWKESSSLQTIKVVIPNSDYQQAINKVFATLQEHCDAVINAVGHRIVHGGEQLSQPILIDETVIEAIRQNSQLAPLHNPANLEGILAIKKSYSTIPQVAVFDTAFHQSMDEVTYLYPINLVYYEKYKVRKYGFHGISHQYVAYQASRLLDKPLEQCQLITAHLGNGASVTAIKGGKSVDTSMGFTPLAGLMMGTRSGDIDPGIHAFLCQHENKSIDEITTELNKDSGLLGVSEISMDMRILHQQAKKSDKRAILAIEIFCNRLSKMIAAQAINLTRIDALVFTGGIGENDAIVREKVLNQLELLGFQLDPDSNHQNFSKITTENSTLALVIPTNEELLIAQQTAGLLS